MNLNISFFKNCAHWSIKIIVINSAFDTQNAWNCISKLLNFKLSGDRAPRPPKWKGALQPLLLSQPPVLPQAPACKKNIPKPSHYHCSWSCPPRKTALLECHWLACIVLKAAMSYTWLNITTMLRFLLFLYFSGYGKTVSHVVIGLKTAKGTKQLKVNILLLDVTSCSCFSLETWPINFFWKEKERAEIVDLGLAPPQYCFNRQEI